VENAIGDIAEEQEQKNGQIISSGEGHPLFVPCGIEVGDHCPH
jgi:hypothetical protein